MRLSTCSAGAKTFLGAQLDHWIIDLRCAWQTFLADPNDEGSYNADEKMLIDMLSMIQGGDEALSLARKTLTWVKNMFNDVTPDKKDFIYPPEGLKFLPPVSRPGKIICVGLNYPEWEPVAGSKPPEYPILFHKVTTSLVGHNQPIVIPRITQKVVYEGELALVIGRTGKYIIRQEVDSYIYGYAIANDVGAPDLEHRTSQWTTGKMLDTFCPIGPSLVTRDEITNTDNLRIWTVLNDEVVQDGNTSDMYFDIPYLVSYISDLVTLEPGDIILTGSPKTSGLEPDPRRPMRTGDIVSVEITDLGVLTNPVMGEE